ncbi:MAG: phage virion morphogenesis protein [Geminicoccaceae bacterium]|nr:phage virion morphogenesis protein [Geminicoccaceae bacterium]
MPGGISVEIRIEDARVQAALAKLTARGRSLYDPLDDAGAYMESVTLLNFRSGTEPGGAPWLKSIRAREEGGQTLVDSSRLRDSITRRTSAESVEVGTNVVYAAIHQFGGVIRATAAPWLRFRVGGRWVKKKQVTIPARPFLGAGPEDNAEILRIFRDWIDGAAPGAIA